MFLLPIYLAVSMQETAPEKQLDFWIGDWDCTGIMKSAKGDTKTVATNHIHRVLNGKVIEENFKMSGLNGLSHSVYVPAAKLWKQTWVDDQGSYIALSGGQEGDKFILTTLENPNRPATRSRMVFSNITKESFSWDWEATVDGGKTWTLSWHLDYRRKK